MQRTFMLMIMLTSMLSTGLSQTKQKMKNTLNDEQKEVLEAVLAMTTAFHKGDIDGVMASYEPEATVVFEPELPINDRAAIRSAFKQAFTINPVFTYGGHEVFVNGNIAIHLAPWEMKGTAPDGSVIKQKGLSMAVLRKQKDGSWLMVFDNPHSQFLYDQQ